MNEKEYQYIGTISSPNGFKGKINLKDVPEGIEKIRNKSTILCGFSPKFAQRFTLDSFSKKETKAVVILNEVKSDKEVFDLKEKGLFTHQENLVIPEKEVLTDDIIGVTVIEQKTGNIIGEIIDVWYLPGNDVWLAKTNKGNLPLPVIEDVIIETDWENSKIFVNIIDGLWDIAYVD